MPLKVALEVTVRDWASAALTAPPLRVAPERFQEPVEALRKRPPERVPPRFTVPPERLKVPKSDWLKVPPKLTVDPLVLEITPRLDQALEKLPRLRVEALAEMVEPGALVQVPVRLRVPPA